MLIDLVKKGSTDRSLLLRFTDRTTGLPETGITHIAPSLAPWYRREGGGKVNVNPAELSSLTAAHTDGGFLHISDGFYRLDLPDAAFASGANFVDFGASEDNTVATGGRVRLVDFDPESPNLGGGPVELSRVPDFTTWRISRRFDGTYESTNTVTVVAGDQNVLCGFDCLPLLAATGGDDRLSLMTAPTASGSGVTPETASGRFGIDQRFAKLHLDISSGATLGQSTVSCTVSTAGGSGPLALKGKLQVVAP